MLNDSSTTEVAIKTLFDYLRLEDKPGSADVIFILGGSSLAPVTKAAELYKLGYSTKIAFISTGGRFGGDAVWGMPEHEKYYAVLRDLQIPAEAIISKGLTTNTLAEAQAAIPFLKEHGINATRIILVARPVHQRRAFATFRKQHPYISYLNCPANEPLDVHNQEISERLVGEVDRLVEYAKKGDIEAQEISFDILQATEIVRTALKMRK